MTKITNPERPVFRDSAASLSLLELAPGTGLGLVSLQSALQRIGVLSSSETLTYYEDLSSWRRGGAETYVADFRITISSDSGFRNVHLIAKAIVKWATPPEKAAYEWLRRQTRLKEFGVAVAQIFGTSAGIIYQEFIPYPFECWFGNADMCSKNKLAYQLRELAAKVDAAGFAPVEFISDLRTDGFRIFIVDLGADLGGFNLQEIGSATRQIVEKWLESHSGKGNS